MNEQEVITQLELEKTYLEATVRIVKQGLNEALELLSESDRKVICQHIQDMAATETAAFAHNVGKMVGA